MKWLLWKDYRHNRLIVFAGLALLLGPYLIGLGVICGGRWVKTGMHDGQTVYWTPPWVDIIARSSIVSLGISQLTIALVGGNAISGERVDRSAEFLYSLPITRRRLLASKLVFALLVTAVIWLVNIAVLWCLVGLLPLPDDRYEDFLADLARITPYIAITGLVFFCVAWFLSSFVTSPAFDVCGGLITPFLVITSIALIDSTLANSGLREHCLSEFAVELWYWAICLSLALVCFAAGTWHYLRRVEP